MAFLRSIFFIAIICSSLSYSSFATEISSLSHYTRQPTNTFLRAEARVHKLYSALLCQKKTPLNKKCSSSSEAQILIDLQKAVASFEQVAKKERMVASRPPPPYVTTVIEPTSGKRPEATVVFLHGLEGVVEPKDNSPGQKSELERLVPLLKCSHGGILSRIRVVLPQAFVRYNSLFDETTTNWFSGPDNFWDTWNSDEVFGAAGNISSLFDIVSDTTGISRKRLAVAGRSQGGALTVTVYLRHGVVAAGLMVGFLPAPRQYPNAMSSLSKDSPMLWYAAGNDEVVPLNYSKFSANRVINVLNRNVSYHIVDNINHEMTTPNNVSKEPELLRSVMEFVTNEAGVKGMEDGKCIDVDPVVWKFK